MLCCCNVLNDCFVSFVGEFGIECSGEDVDGGVWGCVYCVS